MVLTVRLENLPVGGEHAETAVEVFPAGSSHAKQNHVRGSGLPLGSDCVIGTLLSEGTSSGRNCQPCRQD